MKCALCIGEGTVTHREPDGSHVLAVCPRCRGEGVERKIVKRRANRKEENP